MAVLTFRRWHAAVEQCKTCGYTPRRDLSGSYDDDAQRHYNLWATTVTPHEVSPVATAFWGARLQREKVPVPLS